MIMHVYAHVGWGHWGGLGTKRSTKKRVIKYEPGKVRKDSEMKFVIINDQRDKKLAKHLVSDYSFTCTCTCMYSCVQYCVFTCTAHQVHVHVHV